MRLTCIFVLFSLLLSCLHHLPGSAAAAAAASPSSSSSSSSTTSSSPSSPSSSDDSSSTVSFLYEMSHSLSSSWLPRGSVELAFSALRGGSQAKFHDTQIQDKAHIAHIVVR